MKEQYIIKLDGVFDGLDMFVKATGLPLVTEEKKKVETLNITKVFKTFRAIAKESGKDSQSR